MASPTTLQQILAQPGPVLLCGPAGAGKLEAAMELYRHFVDHAGQARCLLLVPNSVTAAKLRRQLLAESSAGVLLGPQVLTFTALAGRVLSAAGVTTCMLTGPRRHLLLRRILQDLAIQKRLRALAPVADTPGVLAVLDRSIAELKRAAVEPEDLSRALGPSLTPKQADLLEVYRRYQQHLLENHLYDIEGHMWIARDALAGTPSSQPPRGLEGITAVAAAGFTDFTPTQLRMLQLLADRMDHVLLTLPCSSDARDRLWHWTRRSRESIRAALGQSLREIDLPAPPPTRGPADLATAVFDFDTPPQPLPQGLCVIAAAGMDAEIAAVARRIKRLLVEGAPPGSVAVLARSLEGSEEALQRIFAEHRIPISARGTTLVQSPLVRFVLHAAQICGDYQFRHVLRTIRNSYFRPAALGPFTQRTVLLAETIIREGNVLRGREAYSQAAARLMIKVRAQLQAAPSPAVAATDDAWEFGGPGGDQACCVEGEATAQPLTARLGRLDVQPGELEQAADMLQRLFDACQEATTPQGLRRLAQTLQLREAILQQYPASSPEGRCDNADRIAEDLRALAALEQALHELASEPAEVPPTLADIEQALSTVRVPAARSESLVDVLDVLDARTLRYDHVFLLDLEEGSFPRTPSEGSIISEADRAAWARHGVVLDGRGDLNAREMLLFYLAISRSRHSLTLCYQAADAAGKPCAPSPFLTNLLEPLGGLKALAAAGRVTDIPAGQFVPPPDEIASPRDALAARVLSLLQPGQLPPASRGTAPAAPLPQTDVLAPVQIDLLAAGLLATHRRWQAGPCDSFDGLITQDDLLDQLRRLIPDEMVFSASSLNAFGQCPWRFFGTYLLNLHELAQPQRELEAVSAGTFCHDVLWRVMSHLSKEGGVELSAVSQERVLAALEQALEAESAIIESNHPPYPMLWKLQRDQLAADLRAYLLQQLQETDLSPRCLHFELAFGLSRLSEAHDPHSQAQPVPVELPGGLTIRLRGKIDRIDSARFGESDGLLVVDYKTGRLPSEDDILSARNVQLPLYIEAARQLLGQHVLGGAFHQVGADNKMRMFAEFRRRGRQYSSCDNFDEIREQVLGKVAQHVNAMREGRFVALPSASCPPYCPYRQICHFSPARADMKTTRL